jgi:hypothetical protein
MESSVVRRGTLTLTLSYPEMTLYLYTDDRDPAWKAVFGAVYVSVSPQRGDGFEWVSVLPSEVLLVR